MTDENTYLKNEPLIFKLIYIVGGISLTAFLILEWVFNISNDYLQVIGFLTMTFYFLRKLYRRTKEKGSKRTID